MWQVSYDERKVSLSQLIEYKPKVTKILHIGHLRCNYYEIWSDFIVWRCIHILSKYFLT